MATPPPTLPDTCPRCGGGFACGASAGHCDCFDLQLSEALREQLAARYPGQCLCLRCLRELAAAEAGTA
ncbi:MAG: cysteine-rich CWC family protein [Roseateles sp.]